MKSQNSCRKSCMLSCKQSCSGVLWVQSLGPFWWASPSIKDSFVKAQSRSEYCFILYLLPRSLMSSYPVNSTSFLPSFTVTPYLKIHATWTVGHYSQAFCCVIHLALNIKRGSFILICHCFVGWALYINSHSYKQIGSTVSRN